MVPRPPLTTHSGLPSGPANATPSLVAPTPYFLANRTLPAGRTFWFSRNRLPGSYFAGGSNLVAIKMALGMEQREDKPVNLAVLLAFELQDALLQ